MSQDQGGEGSAFQQLCGIIADIIGADAADIIDIQPGSRFVTDLGMDSIKIVVLLEQGNRLYDGRINFTAWLTNTAFRDPTELTVGDVVEFIERSLESKDTAVQ